MSGAFKPEVYDTIEIKKQDSNPFQTPVTPKTPIKDELKPRQIQGEEDYQAMIE